MEKFQEVVDNLKMKSAGPGVTPNMLLKQESLILMELLTYIFNLFLPEWTQDQIGNIYKKGDHQNCSNYRD